MVERISELKPSGSLRPGDVVEVRPASEILATLDESGSLEGVPFMPEMLQYVGGRFRVSRRVEKICDTAAKTYSSWRTGGTVFLEDLRCDGSGHDGCEARCRLYWKEEWLRRADGVIDRDPPQPGAPNGSAHAGTRQLESVARRGTKTVRELEGRAEDVHRCQATDAPAFSRPMTPYDPRQYVREVTSGNVSAFRVLEVGLRAVETYVRRRFRHLRTGHRMDLPLAATTERNADRHPLDLQAGDLVRIRSPKEIAATLDERGMNRGLWFDEEMLPFCGATHRVLGRVSRIIDDQTGRMIEFSSDCVILDGVACSGELSWNRWFCPRGIYPFWREAWLQRVDDPPAATPRQP